MKPTPGTGTPPRAGPPTLGTDTSLRVSPPGEQGSHLGEPPSAGWWVRRWTPEHIVGAQHRAGHAVGAQWMFMEWA